VTQADLEYRRKMARKWVTSWLAARQLGYENLPMQYRQDLGISEHDYMRAEMALPLAVDDFVDGKGKAR
jgi:hypothetical protein